jgi:hypothetical protein
MSRLAEWFEDAVDSLELTDVMLGVAIGVTIFFVLLVVVIFFALYGPVVIAALFILLLCIGVGVLIVGNL